MIDFNSSAWHQIRKWAEQELAAARQKNDATGLTDRDTQVLRGEIRLLKRFLDLPNSATRVVVAEPDE